jgi:hypothetical protein
LKRSAQSVGGGQAFQLFGEVRGATRGILLTADERGPDFVVLRCGKWTQMGKKMETGPPSLRFGAAGKMPVLRNGTSILRISFCRFTIFHFRGKTYGKVFGENKISSGISSFLLKTREFLTF